jgi:hypothetical protein
MARKPCTYYLGAFFITSSCAAMAAKIFFSVKMTAQNSIYFFRKA